MLIFRIDNGHCMKRCFQTSCVFSAYEYVADSEEATLSQAESVKSSCSDAEFRSRTLNFLDSMARLRQEVLDEERQQKESIKVSSTTISMSHKNVMGSADTIKGLYETEVEPYLTPKKQETTSLRAKSECRLELSANYDTRARARAREIAAVASRPELAPRLSLSRLDEETVCMADVTWQHPKQRPPPTIQAESAIQLQQNRLQETFKELEIARQQEIEKQKAAAKKQELEWQLELDKMTRLTGKRETSNQEVGFAKQLESALIKEISKQESIVKQQEIIMQPELVRQQELTKQELDKKSDVGKGQEIIWRKKVDKLLITVKQKDGDQEQALIQKQVAVQQQQNVVQLQQETSRQEVKRREQAIKEEASKRQQELARQEEVAKQHQEELTKQRELAWQDEITKLLEKALQQKPAASAGATGDKLHTSVVKEQDEVLKNQSESTDESNLISIQIGALDLLKQPDIKASKPTLIKAAEVDVAAALMAIFEVIGEISKAAADIFAATLSISGDEICHLVVYLERTASYLLPQAMPSSLSFSIPDNIQFVLANVRVSMTENIPSLAPLSVDDAGASLIAWTEVHCRQVNSPFADNDKLIEPRSSAKDRSRPHHSDDSSEDDVYYDASDVNASDVVSVSSSELPSSSVELRSQTMEDLISELTAIAGEVQKAETVQEAAAAANEDLLQPATEIKTEVQRPPTAPVFDMPLSDVTAFDGGGAILECRVTGSPLPDVMWFINGTEIKSSPPEVTLSYHAGVCRLVIVDVLPDDEGEYMVRAVNGFGSAVTTCYLTVLR